MPRVHHVKKARKAIPDAGIAVGDEYYWWKFRTGGKQVSKTYPKRSQLTQSKMSGIYDAVDGAETDLQSITDGDGAKEIIDSVSAEVREVAEEYRAAAEEHFGGGGPNGERAEELEGWAEELDGFEAPEREEESCDACTDSKGSSECFACQGKGSRHDQGADHRCGKCDGKGTVDCPECDGSGNVPQDEAEWLDAVRDEANSVLGNCPL